MRDIKLKTLRFECGGCPTSYSGITDEGISFYCRLRHGHMRFELNNHEIFDVYPDDMDGVCGWDDFKEYAEKNGWEIDDSDAECSSFIDDIEKALENFKLR